jgi:hypothetical protein
MRQFIPLAKKENIVIQELDNEVLIYDLNINKAFCLNETSAIIWQLCDGTKTVSEISQAVGNKFNSTVSEDFVWLALEQFRKDKLMTNDFEGVFEEVFKGQTRREVIRKVALASMVALPVVSSIIAPTAINAQSGTCICTTPGDCLTQTTCPSTVNCNGSMQCAP